MGKPALPPTLRAGCEEAAGRLPHSDLVLGAQHRQELRLRVSNTHVTT